MREENQIISKMGIIMIIDHANHGDQTASLILCFLNYETNFNRPASLFISDLTGTIRAVLEQMRIHRGPILPP